ncbi:MFS transporter [Streptomyces ginkgonis]|uniref:MFS transporter n=1 Tax=Streptomyces ginkgonis TaxID=1812259 RepID=UPI002176A3AD|nr:MFS transporter [Streptomyces ginkgonis]
MAWGIDLRPLRIPAFRRLWLSSAGTAFGASFTAVAIPLQIYGLTGSSAYVGLSALAALGPLTVAALWGGALADAVDRRRLLLVTGGAMAAVGAALWLTAGADSPAPLFVLLGLLQGCYGAIHTARGSTVPRLVPGPLLPAANALDSTVRWLGPVLGPLLAGALLSVASVTALYAVNTLMLTLVLIPVWRLPPLPGTGRRRARLREAGAGLRYLLGRRLLWAVAVADLVAMVFGNPVALFPELSQRTFGDPPGGGFALGLLTAAMALGAVLAGFVSGLFTRLVRHGRVITLAVCGWGLAVAAFGLTRRLWPAALLLVLGGAALMVLSVFRSTLIQQCTPDALRGRLQGVMTVVSAGGPWLAQLAHGTAGAALGTTWAITGGGLLTVAAVLVLAALVPELTRYRAGVTPAPPPPAPAAS